MENIESNIQHNLITLVVFSVVLVCIVIWSLKNRKHISITLMSFSITLCAAKLTVSIFNTIVWQKLWQSQIDAISAVNLISKAHVAYEVISSFILTILLFTFMRWADGSSNHVRRRKKQ